MPRFIDILWTLTYSVAACVAALALMRFAGLSPIFAITGAGVTIMICLQLHTAGSGAGFRRQVARELTSLKRAQAALEEGARETAGRLETLSEEVSERGGEREKALVSEMKVIEGLIRRMSDKSPAAPAPGAPPAPAEHQAQQDVLRVVKDALAENRVDLYLQPIVSLPQRRTVYYESYTRLRDHQGRVVMPAEFLQVAGDAGLMAAIDNMLLFRCVQVVRRLAKKDRRIGVFCNLATESLEDEEFFPQFLDFMRQNSDLAGSLVFEIGQTQFERRSPEAARNMARLADYGFRFSIDHAHDLNADFAEMRRAGVNFFKAPGESLVNWLMSGAETDVAPQDYAGHLARFGIELIAEKIEEETTVVEVLDLDAALGQGHLFGEPRPIREDVLTETEPAPSPVSRAEHYPESMRTAAVH